MITWICYVQKAYTHARACTHTLHIKLKHHSTQKCAVIPVFTQHVRTLCSVENLDRYMKHLKKSFKQKGYSSCDINCALYLKHKLLR
jgi:hypothetical protein